MHVAVVDPGVGTSRAAIAVSAGGHLFVGPDNGVLSLAAGRGRAVSLTIATTFCRVSPIRSTGVILRGGCCAPCQRCDDRQARPRQAEHREAALAEATKDSARARGSDLSVDRFGNLITNFEPRDWSALRRPRLVAGDFVSRELVRATPRLLWPGAAHRLRRLWLARDCGAQRLSGRHARPPSERPRSFDDCLAVG